MVRGERRNREIMTLKEKKKIWDDAVKATLREVGTYDGVIENEYQRTNLIQQVYNKLSYEKEKLTVKVNRHLVKFVK